MDFKGNGDSKQSIIVTSESGQLTAVVGVERIKNEYICEGSSASDLASKFHMPVAAVEKIIEDNKLDALRAAHIKHGLAQLQNIQLVQAEKLMNLENQFKKIRIIQLEKMLEDYMAYYARYGHFYKVHPINGEILRDTNGIAIQLHIPKVSHEIKDLKESVTLSAGLQQIVSKIEDIINTPKDVVPLDSGTIDMDKEFDGLFKPKKSDSEEA